MEIIIEPLRGFPVIRDLVIDRTETEERILELKPYLQRTQQPTEEPEIIKSNLQPFFESTLLCRECYVCHTACPMVELAREKFCGPTLMLKYVAPRVYDPRDEGDRLTQAVSEGLWYCLDCGMCKEVCWRSVDVPDIAYRKIREKVKEKSTIESEVDLAILGEVELAIKERHNIFGKETPRAKWAEDLNLLKNGEVLYFNGCSAAYTYPKTARATVKILSEAGVDVAYLGEDEWCCGMPMLMSGNPKEFEEIIEHNLSKIKASGAKKIIFSCSDCYNTFKTHYKSRVGNLPFEVFHISEIISDLIKQNKLDLKPVNMKITYHDPCHLGRGETVYEQPREILKKISQTELYEMPRNRNNALCCGGGFIVSTLFPDLTRRISADRIREAKDTGADAIVTCCPGCVATLSKAAAFAEAWEGVEIKVYDLPIIIAEAAGLKL
jgi:Fe-S oxidoreductase